MSRRSGAAGSGLAGLLIFLLAGSVSAAKVRVSSVGELHAALQNGDVYEVEVVAGATPGAWNFSTDKWPSQVVLERGVAVTGVDGPGWKRPHLDMNRLTELVVVRASGILHQRNLAANDCLVPVMPLLCFAVGADNGSIVVEGMMLGDATCTDISQSTATDWLLKSAYWATRKSNWFKVDNRSIYVTDTGEISGIPQGVRWRVINTTFRCTGNETHLRLGGMMAGNGGGQPSDSQILLATSATLLASLAMLYYVLNRNVVYVHREDSAEAVVARSKGIILQALIGQGTFGRVYRGQYCGKIVAIKVIEFPLYERRAAAEVAKECQHAMACCHPSISRCLTHFTVTVRMQMPRCPIARTSREAEMAYAHEQLLQAHVAQRPQQPLLHSRQGGNGGQPPSLVEAEHQGQPASNEAAPAGLPHAASEPSGTPSGGAWWTSLGTAAGRGGTDPSDLPSVTSTSSSSSAAEGFMALLVMEYCSLGNLHRAIAEDRFFVDRHRKHPNLDWIVRTVRDVAEGLAHLHEERHIVHRDVSTNNVLLVPDPSDPRGFRAKLSDFGLSTVLRDRQTHKTSQLKGTVDFMPPEIFTCGEIRFAVDIYSLGIMVYWMCKGEGPFTGLAPFQVVGRKLEEVHRKQRLLLPPTMPANLRRLVWDCCHWDPRHRPAASKVATRLTGILHELAEDRLMQLMRA